MLLITVYETYDFGILYIANNIKEVVLVFQASWRQRHD